MLDSDHGSDGGIFPKRGEVAIRFGIAVLTGLGLLEKPLKLVQYEV